MVSCVVVVLDLGLSCRAFVFFFFLFPAQKCKPLEARLATLVDLAYNDVRGMKQLQRRNDELTATVKCVVVCVCCAIPLPASATVSLLFSASLVLSRHPSFVCFVLCCFKLLFV